MASASCAKTLPKKIIVFGGNGYIGQNVANRALSLGLEVTSISRSGPPTHPIDGYAPGWVNQVTWEKGDVLDFSPCVDWKSVLKEKDGAVSCIGAFGSNEFMEKLNGHANVNIAKLSSEAGLKNLVFISADGDHVPSFILPGYFNGKRLADQAVSKYFRGAGVILKPGFVHGPRKIGSITLPLHWVGRPLEWLLCSTGLSTLNALSSALPVSVEDVAIAAVAGSIGELNNVSSIAGADGPAENVVVCRHDDIIAIRNRTV
mmetsp:Transcript_28096/g.47497  ORF Transcript_28096/g.47497 Transcript_28096/m.47497 type:complete len:260 (+) Transcript_28096:79-858(+)